MPSSSITSRAAAQSPWTRRSIPDPQVLEKLSLSNSVSSTFEFEIRIQLYKKKLELGLNWIGLNLVGEVYICGMSEDAEVPDDPEEVVGREESIRMLHKVAETVSSRLGRGEGVKVEAEQACFLPCTEDGLPVIGEMPDVKGFYVATGHSCWGILNGPATGAALAELVLDGQATIVDLTPFSPARFLRSSRRPR